VVGVRLLALERPEGKAEDEAKDDAGLRGPVPRENKGPSVAGWRLRAWTVGDALRSAAEDGVHLVLGQVLGLVLTDADDRLDLADIGA